MRHLTAWTLGLAFVSGLLSPDVPGTIATSLAAFVLAFAFRRAPWRWAGLSVTAWATGAAVGMLMQAFEIGLAFVPPTQGGMGLIVLVAYLSAFAGAWVSWVASRVVRDRY